MELLYLIQGDNVEEFTASIQKLEENEELIKLNAFESGGASLIHWAAVANQPEFLNILLDKKIFDNITLRDTSGATPLHWAAGEGKANAMTVLIKRGIDIERKDDIGETALHWAALNGHIQAIELLLSKLANINSISDQGYAPIHNAVLNSHLACISCLIKHGCEINIKDKHGKTARDLAVDKKQFKVADYFNEEKRETYEKMDGLETSNQLLRTEVQQLTEQKEELSTKLHNTYKELIEVQKNWSELTTLVTQLKSEQAERETALVTEQTKSRDLTAQCERLTKQNSELESQVNVMRAKTTVITSDQPHLLGAKQRDEMLDLKASLTTLQQLLNGAVISVGSVKSQIDSLTQQ